MPAEVIMWENLIKELPCLTSGADLGVLLGDLYDVLNRGYVEVLDNLWRDSVKMVSPILLCINPLCVIIC
jgi:hypothetical protein